MYAQKNMAGLSKAESGNHALGRPCHFSVTILILPDPLAGCDFCDEGDHQPKKPFLNRLASQCHQLLLTNTFEADLLADIFVCQGKKHVSNSPIGSMYGIYANIWGIYIYIYIDGKCYHI